MHRGAISQACIGGPRRLGPQATLRARACLPRARRPSRTATCVPAQGQISTHLSAAGQNGRCVWVAGISGACRALFQWTWALTVGIEWRGSAPCRCFACPRGRWDFGRLILHYSLSLAMILGPGRLVSHAGENICECCTTRRQPSMRTQVSTTLRGWVSLTKNMMLPSAK